MVNELGQITFEFAGEEKEFLSGNPIPPKQIEIGNNSCSNQGSRNKTKHTQQFYPKGCFQFFIPEWVSVIVIFDFLHRHLAYRLMVKKLNLIIACCQLLIAHWQFTIHVLLPLRPTIKNGRGKQIYWHIKQKPSNYCGITGKQKWKQIIQINFF